MKNNCSEIIAWWIWLSCKNVKRIKSFWVRFISIQSLQNQCDGGCGYIKINYSYFGARNIDWHYKYSPGNHNAMKGWNMSAIMFLMKIAGEMIRWNPRSIKKKQNEWKHEIPATTVLNCVQMRAVTLRGTCFVVRWSSNCSPWSSWRRTTLRRTGPYNRTCRLAHMLAKA